MKNVDRTSLPRYAVSSVLVLLWATSAQGQTLSSIYPPSQRVHEYIELQGSGFGTSQSNSLVRFTTGVDTWDGGRAYVWRDNFIRIRVPVGKLVGAAIVPISKDSLDVFVQVGAMVSNPRAFRVVSAGTGTLEFRQLTAIAADHGDTSIVLGSPNMNSARTKDAEIADVNGDGWPDLSDNNSNNVQNNSHTVLRLNNQDKSFTAIAFEPLDAADSGTFPVEVSSGGDFFQDHTSYDADYADINNDRLPDLIQTAADNFSLTPGAHRVRILMNNRGGLPGQFSEETAARMPGSAFGSIGCPDDLDHIDMDDDGDVDFLVTLRTSPGFCSGDTSEVRVFTNTGSGVFAAPTILNSRADNSTHDAFWIDADHDGQYDIIFANEWNNADGNAVNVRCQLLLNDGAGGFAQNRTFDIAASAGDVGDFNGDGLMDFVLGRTEVRVFLTRSNSPCLTNPSNQCTYDEVVVMADDGTNNPFYDFEIGDVNLDGFVDIVGARIRPSANNVPIWINNGSGTAFNDITGGTSSSVLPGNGSYQRLSAELIDFDLDGDLDLYVTGQDTSDDAPGSDPGFGRGPNQFFENLLIGLDIVSPRQAASAYAGSSTGGRKVLVRLRNNLPVSGLAPSDFVIAVDGTSLDPSATVTGAAIEEEFWLLVQMPAKSDGCYSLEVSLASDPAIKDVELEALCYEAERLFDRALAIDRTTSMLFDMTTVTPSPEKMDSARAAAKFFVNLSEDSDRIGVTSFKRDADDGNGIVEQDELAQTDFAMRMAFDTTTSTDNRDLAIDVIDAMQPDGLYFEYQTAIGAGLREAWNEVQDEGDASHEWEIVLLTDGLENFPPYWSELSIGPPVVLPLRPEIVGADPHVTVHTVAIGPAADAPLLIEIADATGGQFFNLYEGTASLGLMSRLASVYKYIDEEMRDEQRFFYREGVPEPVVYTESPFGDLPDTLTHGRKVVRVDSFVVPTGFESISVGFHWNRNNAVERVLLYDPSLAVITSAPPVRTIRSDPKHKIYRIRDPKPGRYYYTVELGTADPFEFFAVASGITDLLAIGRKGAVREPSPGHFEIPLRIISGDFKPILFASVKGDVILPDKSHIPITLHDDGAHEDGADRDGIYAQVFAHTMPGGYTAELVTTGVSSRNEPFTRYTIMSFAFPGTIPDREEPKVPPRGKDPGDAKPRPADCIPCWLQWVIIIVFLVLLILILRGVYRRT